VAPLLGMTCSSCVYLIESNLSQIEGEPYSIYCCFAQLPQRLVKRKQWRHWKSVFIAQAFWQCRWRLPQRGEKSSSTQMCLVSFFHMLFPLLFCPNILILPLDTFHLQHRCSHTAYCDPLSLLILNPPTVFFCWGFMVSCFLLRYSRRNRSNRGSGLQGQGDQ